MYQFGIFGNPVEHSLSPIIHAQFGKQTRLNIGYEKILTPLDGFSAAAKSFIGQGADGFNITLPFKVEAYKLANELSPQAKIAGAVNTIKVEGDKLIGENTDGVGLVQDLTRNLSITLKHKVILILGAGGATRGILLPLLQQQPKRLMIANRTAEKAVKLATDFAQYGNLCGFGLEKIKSQPVDIIINATSASVDGETPKIVPAVANGAICYDLMYGIKTPFMNWAKTNQAKLIVDGTGMLVEQAAVAFEFWTGKQPTTKMVLKKIRS